MLHTHIGNHNNTGTQMNNISVLTSSYQSWIFKMAIYVYITPVNISLMSAGLVICRKEVENWAYFSQLNTIMKFIKLILKLVPYIPLGTEAHSFTKISLSLYDIPLGKRASKECLVLAFPTSLGDPIDRLRALDRL